MINTGDLHIEDEIRPLFDFTFNHLSGKAPNYFEGGFGMTYVTDA